MPIYMHNVLPTTYGHKSVGYTVQTPSINYDTKFDKAYTVRTASENRYIFSSAKGTNYFWREESRSWDRYPFSSLTVANTTVAYIHQKTYICYEKLGVYEFDEVTKTLVNVTLQGLDKDKLLGITYANNYLIGYTADTIYWSSAIDATDFTPSLSTTAGSEQVNSVKGRIVAVTPIADGFIIHTTANQVTARYTGNEKILWNFVEIAGSTGITNIEHVAYDSNSELQFTWTRAGLHVTDLRSPKGATCTQFLPEISDYLLDTLQEEYIGNKGRVDHTNISRVWASETQTQSTYLQGQNNLVQYRLTNTPLVKVTCISNRYLCISYTADATNIYQYCLVYDLALKRMGKLKIPHVDCFEFYYPPENVQDNFNCIGFLSKEGTVTTVNSSTIGGSDSVFIFGKCQHSRDKMLVLTGIELENATDTAATLSVLTSLDGKNFLPDYYPKATIRTKNFQKYLCRLTGVNHSFKIVGDFHLVSLQGTATTSGDR
jgi:hypothetical protein